MVVRTQSPVRAPLVELIAALGVGETAAGTPTICICDDGQGADPAADACVVLRAGEDALHQSRLVIGAQNRSGGPGTPCRLPPEGHIATVVAELGVAAALIQALLLEKNPRERPRELRVDAEQVALHLIWPLISGLSVGVRGTTMRAPALTSYPFGIVPCADGLVGCYQAVPSEWPAFCRMTGRPDLIERYPTQEDRRLAGAAIWTAVREWFEARPVASIIAAAQLHGLPFAAVQRLADFGSSPYLRRRGLSAGPGGDISAGLPFLVHNEPSGATTSHRRRETLRQELFRAFPAPGSGALAGVIVVEVTQHWAGPLLGRLLADHGALVLKCEPRTGDWWRTLGRVSGEEDVSWTFEAVNLGKASIAMDLRDDGDRLLLAALVSAADAFIENVSPEARNRNRLDFRSNRASNPDILQVSLPAYESAGPLEGERGMGWSFEAASGYSDALGGADGPANSGFPYGDPVGAVTAFLAVLRELARRRLEPEHGATLIDCGQVGALAYTLVEVIRTGELPGPPQVLADPFAQNTLPEHWRVERVETARSRLIDHPVGPIEVAGGERAQRRRAPLLDEQGALLRRLVDEAT